VGIDPDALAAEVPGLYRMARALARDPDRASDLVQDTVERALRRREQFRGDGPLGAWLRRILHHLAVDQGRRSRFELVVEDVEARWRADEYTIDAAVVVERALQREEIEDALARLPFHYRAALVLHDMEGWTVREIADAADIGLPAAKQRLRRGRMMMVDALADGAARRVLLEGVPMRCWEARQHVSDYLDGVLDRDVARTVEAHLERCPTCPPLYAGLVETHAGLSRARDPDSVVPPALQERIAAALADESHGSDGG